MFFYTFLGSTAAIAAVATSFWCGLFDKCAKNLQENLQNFKDLYAFAGAQNYRGFKRYQFCFEIIAKIMYTSILQSLNKSVKKIGGDEYEILYVIEGKAYATRVKVNRGPANFILATDVDSGNDITEILGMYAGPDKDFENKFITPGTLGLKNITVVGSFGDQFCFSETDRIIF